MCYNILSQISKAMKSDSRYLEMLQRVPLAEKGCTERYSERSEFWKQNRIKPWSCIPTTRIWRVETMMGAPITAQEYRCFIRTFSTMRMTQETSVLVKACVVRHRRTKMVPRAILSRPWKQGRDFLRSKHPLSQNKNERMYKL